MSREMKNSGIPWIGEIPAGWQVCFIKQVMRNKSIKGFPDEQVLSLYREHGVVPKDSRDDNHNVTSEDTSGYKLVDIGDFVINKMKAWQGSMAVSDYRGIISPAYYICYFTNEDINKRYIHYLLRNESYKDEYMRLSTGLRVGQWDLNIEDFLRIRMILPSLKEQQAIATILDKKCSEIDEMISLQEKIIEELKAYKQSVITEAVCRGLNPNVPMKDSGIEWIGEIPEGWSIDKIVRSFELIGSGTTPKSTDDTNFEGDIYWIQSGDINGSILTSCKNKISNDTLERFSALKVYDAPFIIVAMYGASVGNACISQINGCVNQACCVLKGDRLNLNYAFNAVKACKDYLIRKAVGGGQPNISQDTIKSSWIPVPPIAEQQSIADYLDEKCGEIDTLIAVKQSKIGALKEYKKSIIYEYVTGKKEVPA